MCHKYSEERISYAMECVKGGNHRECASLTVDFYKKLGVSTEKLLCRNCTEYMTEQDLDRNKRQRIGVEVMGMVKLERKLQTSSWINQKRNLVWGTQGKMQERNQ